MNHNENNPTMSFKNNHAKMIRHGGLKCQEGSLLTLLNAHALQVPLVKKDILPWALDEPPALRQDFMDQSLYLFSKPKPERPNTKSLCQQVWSGHLQPCGGWKTWPSQSWAQKRYDKNHFQWPQKLWPLMAKNHCHLCNEGFQGREGQFWA